MMVILISQVKNISIHFTGRESRNASSIVDQYKPFSKIWAAAIIDF